MKNKLIIADLTVQILLLLLFIPTYLFDTYVDIKIISSFLFVIFGANAITRILFLKNGKIQTKLISIASWTSMLVIPVSIVFYFTIGYILFETGFISDLFGDHGVLVMFGLLMLMSLLLLCASSVIYVMALCKKADGCSSGE